MSGHRLTASMASLLVSLLSNLPSVETVRLHIEKVDDAFDAQEQRTVFASHYPKIVFPALHDRYAGHPECTKRLTIVKLRHGHSAGSITPAHCGR